ncbi:MAG: lipase family protein [Vicinamibacterales bacterium]
MLKPAPIYDLHLVLHPDQDTSYVHFQDAAAHPFNATATAVPRVNVWWLAEAALASYWKTGMAEGLFQQGGLTAEYVAMDSTDCYVAHSANAAIVAFRGTEPDEWKDVLTDVQLAQVPWDAGQVHKGFADALDAIWPVLKPKIDALAPRPIWFCGHSLGAALATLAAYRHGANTGGVCTFGSPRVGNRAFATAFNARLGGRSLRYVNHHDVVTHVPTPASLLWIYQHVDPRRTIAANGVISGAAPSVPHFFGDLIGRPAVLLEWIEGLRHGTLTLAPQFMLDHMPKAYAIWTWNDFDQNG